jgi:16S rRNA (cytosine1407-C5)-methyltransferase
MAAIMNNTGTITALEKSPVRADILRHNISLQGVTNTTIVRQEASSYLTGLTHESFDYILLDSPCSGIGRLRSDREEPWKYIDPTNLQRRSDLQKLLLTQALPLLCVGGSLVYSTCTLGHEENDDVIKAVLR